LKYATSSRDGTVKIWNAHTVLPEMTITVTKDVWVTCLIYMKGSKKLVAASANRMISFYDLNSTQ
jgi:WD40 repeat protein